MLSALRFGSSIHFGMEQFKKKQQKNLSGTSSPVTSGSDSYVSTEAPSPLIYTPSGSTSSASINPEFAKQLTRKLNLVKNKRDHNLNENEEKLLHGIQSELNRLKNKKTFVDLLDPTSIAMIKNPYLPKSYQLEGTDLETDIKNFMKTYPFLVFKAYKQAYAWPDKTKGNLTPEEKNEFKQRVQACKKDWKMTKK